MEQLYTYDSNNRLSELKEIAGKEAGTVSQPEVKVQKFTYDRQGNLLQDGNARYQYDAFGRMEQAETETGMIQKNRYDAEGLRHEMEENGALIQFLYSGEEVVAATKEGEGTTRYIRGYGLISSDSEQARIYYHYVSDEKGSVTHLVSSEGEGVLNEYSYDVFGNRTVLKETVDNLFGYTGQQYDGITGQYYLRARYYNPVIGRFIQEDTYYGDGLNLYVYCCNNPVMYYDPTGHEHEASHNRGGADGADGPGYNPEWGDPDFADRYRDHRYEYDYYAREDAKKQQPGKGGTDGGSNNEKKSNSGNTNGGSGNESDKPDSNGNKPKASNDGTDSSNNKPKADVPDDKPSQGGKGAKGSNADLGNKLDYLFGKATGSKHNIERSKAMQAELARIGIYDTPSGREYLSKHLNDVLKDPTNISKTETRSYVAKEMPGKPVVEYTATTRESLLMGPGGAVLVESVWDGDRLLTIIIKGGS